MPGLPGPPMNLWGDRKTASREGSPPSSSRPGAHVDLHVGTARRVVEAGDGAVPMEQAGDVVDRGDHPRHVGRRAEGADARTPGEGRVPQERFEVLEGDPAVGSQVDGDHGGQALAPGDLVRVVLVGTQEDHRLLAFEVLVEPLRRVLPGPVPDRLEDAPARGRAEGHPEDALQARDGPGGAVAARHHLPPGAGPDRVLDDGLGLLQQVGHAPARHVVLGVGVRVVALQAHEVALDEEEAAPAGGVVGVDEHPLAEGGLEHGVHADDLVAEALEVESPGSQHSGDCIQGGPLGGSRRDRAGTCTPPAPRIGSRQDLTTRRAVSFRDAGLTGSPRGKDPCRDPTCRACSKGSSRGQGRGFE